MKYRYIPAALCSLLLCSCSLGIGAGIGAAVGVTAVQEGGLSRAASDTVIQAKINDLWLRHDFEMFRKLDLTVNQGRVLITGIVQDPEHRVEAVRLAWQPSGVKSVINEIKVSESGGVSGFAKDTWITTRLRTSLTLDKEVESINYSIDTVDGTVYLMGFAQDQAELNRVIETARTVSGVRRVVSYVKLNGAPEGPANLPPAYGQQQNDAYNNGGYNNGGYNNGYNSGQSDGQMTGTFVDDGAYSNSYGNQPAQQDTSNAAPVPSVASGDPIDWNQKSIYE